MIYYNDLTVKSDNYLGEKRSSIVHDFKYVPPAEWKPVKERIIDLIHFVQNDVRNRFTFQYQFIGSSSRKMITRDEKSNIGFDFDVNIMVNDDDENYTPKEIKHILMDSFNRFIRRYGYDYCEDSTRVFTIKVKDTHNSCILHSCDFAVVHNYGDKRQEYIRFNKTSHYYSWEEQPQGFYQLPEKEQFCKENYLCQAIRDLYINKKNRNMDRNKKSRSIYAETIHQICQQNGYYD